jgi:DNA-binding Xre family transcriptional regulator
MPVRNTIKEFVDGLGISVYEFRKRTGLATDTAYNLYNQPEKIPNGTVLSKICDSFKIQPNEILRWEERSHDATEKQRSLS